MKVDRNAKQQAVVAARRQLSARVSWSMTLEDQEVIPAERKVARKRISRKV